MTHEYTNCGNVITDHFYDKILLSAHIFILTPTSK